MNSQDKNYEQVYFQLSKIYLIFICTMNVFRLIRDFVIKIIHFADVYRISFYKLNKVNVFNWHAQNTSSFSYNARYTNSIRYG